MEETSPSSSSQTPQLPASSQPAPAPTPALRVADAQAEGGNPYNEGEMHFTVTLSPAATHEVAVSYTMRDGTASGDLYGLYGDYEEEYGRMSFAPGETRKTVRVRLIGDWHDEGPETSPWCSPIPGEPPSPMGKALAPSSTTIPSLPHGTLVSVARWPIRCWMRWRHGWATNPCRGWT